MDWAASWLTGPDLCYQLAQRRPRARCFLPCWPPSRFGGALKGRDLLWLYACSRCAVPTGSPHQGGETEKLDGVSGGVWMPQAPPCGFCSSQRP